jgi:transposase-like protein
MPPSLHQLIEEIEATKIFRRNKKDVKIKILAALLYFFGLSLRKTSKFISLFEELSYESVRIYYHRLKKVIKLPQRKERKLIAIDAHKRSLGHRATHV